MGSTQIDFARQNHRSDSWYRYSHNSANSPGITVADLIATWFFASVDHTSQFKRNVHGHARAIVRLFEITTMNIELI